MKRKLFALLAFALLVSGGCGGGGSKVDVSEAVIENSQGSEMASVMNTPAFREMWEKLRDDGVFDKINGYYLVFNMTDEQKAKTLEGLDGEERENAERMMFDAENVKEAYDEGQVVAIVYADKGIINKALAAVGEAPNFSLSEWAYSEHLELFAMARKTSGGVTTHSQYVIPMMDDMSATSGDVVVVSGDVSSGDVVVLSGDAVPASGDAVLDDAYEVDSGDVSEGMTREELQIERWRNFYLWCAGLDELAEDNAIEASGIVKAAADNNIEHIADVDTYDFDFSYAGLNVSFSRDGYNRGIRNVSFTRARTNKLTFKVFSAHSPQSGNDYYYVRRSVYTNSNCLNHTTLKPDALWTSRGRYIWVGLTNSVNTSAWLDDLKNGNTPDVSQSSPNTGRSIVWKNGKPVELESVAFDSNWNYNSDPYFDFDALHVIFDSKHTTNYSAWKIDVSSPQPGEKDGITEGFIGLFILDIIPNSLAVGKLTNDSAWVWEVSKSYRDAHPYMKINFDFIVYDLAVVGKGEQVIATNDGRDYTPLPQFQATWTSSFTGSFSLRQPPSSVALKQRSLQSFPANASSQQLELCPLGDWTLSGVPSWLSVSSTSGPASSELQTIKFDVEENTSDTPRTAVLTLSANGDTENIHVGQNGAFTVNGTYLPDTVFFPQSISSPQSVTINAPQNWTASVSDSWIHLDKTSGGPTGEGGESVTISVDYPGGIYVLTNTRERTGTVKFTCGGYTITLNVKQRTFN